MVRSTPAAPGRRAESAATLALVEYDSLDAHAEKLFAALDEALSLAGLAKAKIEVVACDVGPGSFTGIRAGTAALSAIAWALRVGTVAVGSLEAMAFAAQRELGGTPVLTLLDARRGEVFGAVYGPEGCIVEPFHRSRTDEAFLAELRAKHGALVVGEVASEFASLAVFVRPIAALPSASDIARIAAAKENGKGSLAPVYVRAPDAKTTEELARARASK